MAQKNLNFSVEEKMAIIEPGHGKIPLYRQCELLGLFREAYYYRPRPVDRLNDTLMRLIDEQYTKMPFYGAAKMTKWLRRQGYKVNRKRIRPLMRLMGLEAVYSKPWLSKPEIFNSDQGSRFTSIEFTGRLEPSGVRISMDGRGRMFDNIFVKRLWRTVKY